MANITDQSHTLTGVFTRRRSPEPLGSNRPMSTAVAPNTYAGQSVKMTAGLAWTYHTSLSLRGSCQLQNYTRTKYTTRRCPTRGDIHVPNDHGRTYDTQCLITTGHEAGNCWLDADPDRLESHVTLLCTQARELVETI